MLQKEKSNSGEKLKKTKIKNQEIIYRTRESSKASKARIELTNGIFTIVIPENSFFDFEEIIQKKRNWLIKKNPDRKIPERNFEPGEIFSVLGGEKKVIIERRRSNSVEEEIFLAEHLVDRTSIKDQLEKTFRSYAREKIESKADRFSNAVENDYEKIFIRDQKTRWGSCSGENNLNFNWRLVLGPEHVMDYIVAHEVAHLDVKNHGENFWRLLEKIHPEYREGKTWLEENSLKLVFDIEEL